MSELDKKSTVIVLASVAAAATGIAVVAVLFKYRDKLNAVGTNPDEHRHLKQVLSDCYNKINEIEARIPQSGTDQLEEPTVRTGKHQRKRSTNVASARDV